jgi:hypothetical protein
MVLVGMMITLPAFFTTILSDVQVVVAIAVMIGYSSSVAQLKTGPKLTNCFIKSLLAKGLQ